MDDTIGRSGDRSLSFKEWNILKVHSLCSYDAHQCGDQSKYKLEIFQVFIWFKLKQVAPLGDISIQVLI
jgi:hypothetical protein